MRRLHRLALGLVLVLPLAACPEPAGQHAPRPQGPVQPAAKVASPGAVDALALQRPASPEWFGLYLLGKKAGWAHTEMARVERDGRDVVVISSEGFISATVGDKTVSRRVLEERVYEARPAGRLLAFRGEWSGDGGARTLVGSCALSGCQARIGDGPPKLLGAVAETLDLAMGERLAAARRATVSGPRLDLDKLSVEEVEYKFLRRETVAAAGAEAEVSIVSEAKVSERLASEYQVADDGRVLQVTMGGGVVQRLESKETAQKLEAIDLFNLARVKVPRALPRAVPATITFRLKGLPAAFQKPDGRQTFAPGPNGTTRLTVTARRPAAADPARDTPRATPSPEPGWVEATPTVDADHPAIAALAQKVAGDVPGRYAAALKLSEQVHGRLKVAYGVSQDRASDVLATGQGDCTEHSVLLVALARALGIPARQVHGLVYARYSDGQDALYWHAWAEVLSAGQWIALDPTFGQPVADATHITLGQELQADAMGLLGALTVEAVEVKP
jgi:Transglutaminase-like superfamily